MNLAKQPGTKSILRNQRHPCTPKLKYQKQKSGKNPISCRNNKNKVPRNKPNQGGKRSVFRKLHNSEERNCGGHKQIETCTMLMDWKN